MKQVELECCNNICPIFFSLKTEQGVIQFYFRKITLHQQKYLVVSVFFNIRLGCRDI